MKKITSILIFLLAFSLSTHAQENVTVEKDQDGWKLDRRRAVYGKWYELGLFPKGNELFI